LAKYKFLYDEPDDYGDAFDYAYDILRRDITHKYEIINNVNPLYGRLESPLHTTDNIRYYGNINDMNLKEFLINNDDDEYIIHTDDFPDAEWRQKIFGIKHSLNDKIVIQDNVTMIKKPIHWREFLKIEGQFMGGVKDPYRQQEGSAGILIFYRWFLLKNLMENELLNKYDRFIITRSDFIYQLPHPKMELMNKNNIWIPDGEDYGGYTDRHAVLSNHTIIPYLNILNNLVHRSNEFFICMSIPRELNLEKIIKLNLSKNDVDKDVRSFPYVMFSVRNINGSTRWTKGFFCEELGYFIKYPNEHIKSSFFKKEFELSGLNIDDYYRKYLC